MNIKEFYYEIKNLKRFIYFIKDCNITSYEKEAKDFLNEILNDKYGSKSINLFISELLFYLEEEPKQKLFEIIKKFFNF